MPNKNVLSNLLILPLNHRNFASEKWILQRAPKLAALSAREENRHYFLKLNFKAESPPTSMQHGMHISYSKKNKHKLLKSNKLFIRIFIKKVY